MHIPDGWPRLCANGVRKAELPLVMRMHLNWPQIDKVELAEPDLIRGKDGTTAPERMVFKFQPSFLFKPLGRLLEIFFEPIFTASPNRELKS